MGREEGYNGADRGEWVRGWAGWVEEDIIMVGGVS